MGSRTKDLNSCHYWLAVNYASKCFTVYIVSTTNLSSITELLMGDIKCVKSYFTIAELRKSTVNSMKEAIDATHSSKKSF